LYRADELWRTLIYQHESIARPQPVFVKLCCMQTYLVR
jgi:hypothetical protein